MNQEAEKLPRVRVINNKEHIAGINPDGKPILAELVGKTGVIIGTIPPQLAEGEKPNRIKVRLDEGPRINFLPDDIELI